MTLGPRCACLLAAAVCCLALLAPARAQAFNPISTVCGIGGLVSGLAGKACNVGGKVLGVGKKVLGGASSSGLATKAQAAVGLAAMLAWVLGGAKAALHETATVVAHTTAPKLTATWFSSTYWRMAAIGAVLTLPFLFAAAVQALLRSDLALLLRSALGYLPLALIGVGIAAPTAMLLLAATDEMCAGVSAAAGDAGAHFLANAGLLAGLLSLRSGSPFLAFLAGLAAAFGALILWIELLMREAAVYVVVLMLPIAFAALAWPARRVWAVRAVELLVALILSKFAIVAVLTLGGAALGHASSSGVSGMLAGAVLVILAALAPWAMVRLLPLAELASTAAGTLRGESLQAGRGILDRATRPAEAAHYRMLESGSAEETDLEPTGDPADEAADRVREQLTELRPAAESQSDAPPMKDGEPVAAESDVPLNGEPVAGESDVPLNGESVAPTPREPPPVDHHHPDLGPEYQVRDFGWAPFDLDLGAPPHQTLISEDVAEHDAADPPPPDPPTPADDTDPRPEPPEPHDGRL